jgi:hypothetical protein
METAATTELAHGLTQINTDVLKKSARIRVDP